MRLDVHVLQMTQIRLFKCTYLVRLKSGGSHSPASADAWRRGKAAACCRVVCCTRRRRRRTPVAAPARPSSDAPRSPSARHLSIFGEIYRLGTLSNHKLECRGVVDVCCVPVAAPELVADDAQTAHAVLPLADLEHMITVRLPAAV